MIYYLSYKLKNIYLKLIYYFYLQFKVSNKKELTSYKKKKLTTKNIFAYIIYNHLFLYI
jgi:hypothetical protein